MDDNYVTPEEVRALLSQSQAQVLSLRGDRLAVELKLSSMTRFLARLELALADLQDCEQCARSVEFLRGRIKDQLM
jgi:hypothetical protein